MLFFELPFYLVNDVFTILARSSSETDVTVWFCGIIILILITLFWALVKYIPIWASMRDKFYSDLLKRVIKDQKQKDEHK